MRHLLITTDFPPVKGGIASLYGRICEAVGGDKVVVLTLRDREAASFDSLQSYPIVRIGAPKGATLSARLMQTSLLLWHAAWLSRRYRVQSVHIGHLHLGVIGIFLERLLRIPYVLYLHGGEMARYARAVWFRPVVRWIVRSARDVVVNSVFTQEHFASMGIRHPRTRVLVISAPVDRFHPGLNGMEVRPKYGLDGHQVILTVGRLVRRKGHDTMLQAMVHLRKSFPDIRYVIVGQGPEEAGLRALAKTLGLADCVVFAGPVSEAELPYLYATCDVFAMPCRALPTRDGLEGLGIVFLEAAASGKPSVAARTGGIQEAVIDGVTGVLVEPDDADRLASAISELLASPAHASRFGRQGRERALQLEQTWRSQIHEIWR